MNETTTPSVYPGVNHPNKIVVHHTAYPGVAFQYPLVNSWHKGRDFPLSTLGSYVGYQYLIEKNGSYTQCRSEDEGGAHTIGENFSSVGICLAGDFDTELPTEEQKATLMVLMHAIMERHDIPVTNILPHRHFSQTSCNGTKLPDSWAADLAAIPMQQIINELGLCKNSIK